jgi:hypothetical protein
MKSPEEIEQSLQRLMPPALSERAHSNVRRMIASLAADQAGQPVLKVPVKQKQSFPWYKGTAAAAAIAALAIGVSYLLPDRDAPVVATSAPKEEPVLLAENEHSPVLIDRMQLTDGMTVEGTLSAADGTLMNQIKRRVETRERYRDARNGYLITISETRDEKVLLPKRGF